MDHFMAEWKKGCVRIGTPTNLLAVITTLLPVLYLCHAYDCWPETELLLSAWGLTVVSFGALYVLEPTAYYAVLGISGTYLGFLSGNNGNMRVPCATLALDVTGSESGTMQAEVVSTMAICGSIVTSLIATTTAAICGSAVVAVLPAFLNEGLKRYAAAAIFGGTFGNFAVKQPKVAVFGLLIPTIMRLWVPVPSWVVLVCAVVGTVGIARMFFNAEKKETVS